jgi:hypothetical protein
MMMGLKKGAETLSKENIFWGKTFNACHNMTIRVEKGIHSAKKLHFHLSSFFSSSVTLV